MLRLIKRVRAGVRIDSRTGQQFALRGRIRRTARGRATFAWPRGAPRRARARSMEYGIIYIIHLYLQLYGTVLYVDLGTIVRMFARGQIREVRRRPR